ncbi:MAG: hypothetical protein R3Y11_01440 [Pseudomonadota bacterium]
MSATFTIFTKILFILFAILPIFFSTVVLAFFIVASTLVATQHVLCSIKSMGGAIHD